MRIIKNTQEKECTCGNCRSEIAYSPKDIKRVVNEFQGKLIADYYIYCPVCGHTIRVVR